MMRNLFILIFTFFFLSAQAQTKIYDPSANAQKDIEAALKKAKRENKFVLIQAGGNWCSWCIEFARFAKADPKIDSVISASYIWYHLNWSKENKNENILARYKYPQRFGFPVFIILNAKGERIHTQNSSYLEDGKKSYDKMKVQDFLEMWSPRALNPEMYSGKGK
ncbi:MAG: thioredoxin family protein [Ferruginibacter sp.]